MAVQAPKGTKDVLPFEAYKWHYIEDIIRTCTDSFGYREIRTPVFEHTELFLRGVGDTTDVVQKEMYTFEDKGGRSITLKPEGTAGAVRAFIEHGCFNNSLPLKTYYFTPVFRYERPQAGRLREHHQFGVEVFGAPAPSLDVELITLALEVFTRLGIRDRISVSINSIGCPKCRAEYNKVMLAYMQQRKDKLCATCNERMERNPLRILDCKVPACKEATVDAPSILDSLCPECAEHMRQLKAMLDALDIGFTVNPRIVRGLDYYTRTVFELIYTMPDGSDITVCGGGRYDGLTKQIGDVECCGAGFGMGLERLLMVLEQQSKLPENTENSDVYIATMGNNAVIEGIKLVTDMRRSNIKAEVNHTDKSVKAQLKYADKIAARYVLVIGDDEIAGDCWKVKKMSDGSVTCVKKDEIIDYLKLQGI